MHAELFAGSVCKPVVLVSSQRQVEALDLIDGHSQDRHGLGLSLGRTLGSHDLTGSGGLAFDLGSIDDHLRCRILDQGTQQRRQCVA